MEKHDIIQLIEQRIKTEYDKYKGSSYVDFKKTAAIKIYKSLFDLNVISK